MLELQVRQGHARGSSPSGSKLREETTELQQLELDLLHLEDLLVQDFDDLDVRLNKAHAPLPSTDAGPSVTNRLRSWMSFPLSETL